MSMLRGLIKKAKRKLNLHTSGQLQECRPNKHVSPDTLNLCAHCKKQTCENCQIEAPNVRLYCVTCFSTKPELQKMATIQEDEADDDDMFAFDSRTS